MAAMAPEPAARVVATAVLLTMAAVLGPITAAALPGLNPYLLHTQKEAAGGVITAAAAPGRHQLSEQIMLGLNSCGSQC